MLFGVPVSQDKKVNRPLYTGTQVQQFIFQTQDGDVIACCGSGMFIPDPGSWFLTIPEPLDPKPATKERGEKKISGHTFFCSNEFHKTENYFIFETLKKKIWADFQRIIEVFSPKNHH